MNEMNLSGRVTSLFPRFELPRFEPDSLPAENLYRCCGLYQLERERVLLDYPKVGEEVGIWDILGNYAARSSRNPSGVFFLGLDLR